jgi:hypothetical protein
MFSVKNINFILAIFFICSLINLLVMVMFKTNIIKFINTIFKSNYNENLNWTMNSSVFLKILTTITLIFIVVIIILANNTYKIVNCLNKLRGFLSSTGICGIMKLPASVFICIGILYSVFSILLISISKVNIRDLILNTDIRGMGDGIENFVSGNIEGLDSQQQNVEKPIDINSSDNMYYLKDPRNINFGESKLSSFIEKIGSIVFADRFISKPECCTLNENLSTGCLCVEPEDIKMMSERYGNHKTGNTFLTSFTDTGGPDESTADGETLE